MHRNLEIRLRTLNNEKLFTSSELDYYLNLAERAVFEEALTAYDDTDLVKTALFQLLKSVVYTTFTEAGADESQKKQSTSLIVTLPTDFKVAKGERATLSSSAGSTEARVKSVSQDYYNMNIENPFKKPNIDLVWRLDFPNTSDSTKKHELITSSDVVLTKYSLRYIRELPGMSIFSGVDSALHSMTHDEIVNKAEQFALQDLGVFQQKENNKQ